MAVGPFTPYENGLLQSVQGGTSPFDWLVDTIRAALLLDTYTPNFATHDFFDDVSAFECADGDYSQIIVPAKTLTIVANKVTWDCGLLDWGSNVTITAKYLLLFADLAGGPTTDPLWQLSDLDDTGGSVSSVNSDFKVDANPAGVYRITP